MCCSMATLVPNADLKKRANELKEKEKDLNELLESIGVKEEIDHETIKHFNQLSDECVICGQDQIIR